MYLSIPNTFKTEYLYLYFKYF